MEQQLIKVDPEIISNLVLQGDISKMTQEQRTNYYKQFCDSLGLNPLTQPFKIIKFRDNKEQLYATKDCTEQLRKIYKVSIIELANQTINGVYVVTAKAQDGSGRTDAATGAVTIEGLKGDMLANALMKAETKAKRRVTLSICGLGMLDESEMETIPGATTVNDIEAEPEMINDSQLSLIEGLVHNSTLEEHRKTKIENEMFFFTKEKAEKAIEYLRQNQMESLDQELNRAVKNDK